uniref:ATP synthase subunit a n=1 Tax=Zonotrichia albicollis TaxID=44394 RepID=A0A8D2N9X7_ZONAL
MPGEGFISYQGWKCKGQNHFSQFVCLVFTTLCQVFQSKLEGWLGQVCFWLPSLELQEVNTLNLHGHLLIQLISTATTALFSTIPAVPLLTLLVLFLLTILEAAVVIIQAYVFVLLLSLYLQENI